MNQFFRWLLLPCIAPILHAAEVDFSHQVVPILKTHCAECHMGDKKKGGFSMNTREALMEGSENGKVLTVGEGAASLLVKLVVSHDSDDQMPPKGQRLQESEVAVLQAWIDGGVQWEEGFAFKKPSYEPPLKPRRPGLPAALAGRNNPVDRILDTDLAKRGQPAPVALRDGAFYRRLHLDLIGLLPSPEKLEIFLADQTADKRYRAIRELLGSAQPYAEHWMSFWNDLLRNDYAGTGYIDGGRKQISGWLYQALLENKPYDQFVRELVAPTPQSEGFGKGIKWRGEVSAGQMVPVQFAQSMGQTFLGINLKCASCHDSFVDRWKLDEAYGLAAVFASEPLEINRCDIPTGRMAKPGWLFPELGNIDASKPREERLQQLAGLMTHPENGRFTRTIVNRLWHRLMGHGIVHPVDSMQTEPWSSDLLDFLATDLSDHKYDLKHTVALISSSHAYQSVAELLKEGGDPAYHYAGPRSKRLTAEQFTDAIWQITGTAPQKMDAPVQRAGAASSAPTVEKLAAEWIWSDDQKARKAGAGETVSFRKMLALPELPKTGFMVVSCDNEFTLCLNGREMAKGNDWQTPVRVDLLPGLKKGENEIVVVAVNGGAGPNLAGLFIEGRLMGGKGAEQIVKSDVTWSCNTALPKPSGLFTPDAGAWKPAVAVEGGAWKQVDGPIRQLLVDGPQTDGPMMRASLVKSDLLMRALGRPNREQIVSTRPNDLTTLEAMDLNNGQILTTRLADGAKTILRDQAGNDAAGMIRWLYAFAYSRAPSAAELALGRDAIGSPPSEAGLQDLLWAVLVQPEFQMVR